ELAGAGRRTTIDKTARAFTALERANRLASRLGGSHSAPSSRRNSLEDSSISSPGTSRPVSANLTGSLTCPVRVDDVPLTDLDKTQKQRGSERWPYSRYEDSTDNGNNESPTHPGASRGEDT